MNTKKIKTTILTLATTAIATFGLAACDKGTEPGETNVERSEIIEEGSLIGEEGEATTRYDTTGNVKGERYYEHADHEEHSERDAGAVLSGDGTDTGVERDEVQ